MGAFVCRDRLCHKGFRGPLPGRRGTRHRAVGVTVAAEYDVDARLAQGRPAVDDMSEYVRACQQLGYHHPDLTLHPGQVRDWYSGEDGLQLDALAADAAALTAVAAAADDAVRRQSDLL